MGRLVNALVLLSLWQQSVDGIRILRFASPLQTLTIPDHEIEDELATPRERFLPKYKAGLKAEAEARRDLASKRTKALREAAAAGSSNWADKASASERSRRSKEDQLVEEAFDKATAAFDKKRPSSRSSSPNAYQFVGVVNKKEKNPIKWYARKKPADAKWSVRLVHVNQDAVIKDLFNRGKVDIFSKYENTGRVDEETSAPVITGKYEVRERSWKNLWNFSPKHFFTDPSGMYWRERRLRPGLYTDGVSVYESSYRYNDGRNGMHRVSGLKQFMASKSVDKGQKDKISKRLKEDVPDVVLEL